MLYTHTAFALLSIYTFSMIASNRAIPTSLSDTVYHTKNDWAFIVTMIVSGLLLGYSTYQHGFTLIAVGVCVGFCLVGVMPQYKARVVGVLHATGAFLLLGSATMLTILTKPILLVSWLILGVVMWQIDKGKGAAGQRPQKGILERFTALCGLFWVEVVASGIFYVNLWLLRRG